MKHIVLDIDIQKINIMPFSKKKGSVIVEEMKTHHAPQLLFREGVLDLEWVSQKVDEFLAEREIRDPVFHLSFPYISGYIMSRGLEIKDISKKELKKAIPFAIEDNLSISLDDYEYKWTTMKDKDGQKRIFLSVILKSLLDDIKQVFKSRDWKIQVIETHSVSYTRLVPEGGTVIVDISSSETRVMAFLEKEPITVETISHEEDILSYLHEEKSNELTLFPTVTPLERFSESLRQTLFNLRFSHQLEAENIYISADLDELDELSRYLSEKTEEQMTITPFPEGVDKEGEVEITPSYLRTIALAMRNGKDPFKAMNFVQPLLPFTQEDMKKVVTVGVAFSIPFLMGVSLLTSMAGAKVVEIESQNLTLQQEVQRLKTGMEQHDKTLADYHKREELHQKLSNLFADLRGKENTYYLSSILHDLPYKATKNTVIENLTISPKDKIITLKGTSSSYSDVGFFAIALENLGSVELKSVAKSGGGAIQGETIELDAEQNQEGQQEQQELNLSGSSSTFTYEIEVTNAHAPTR